ncbi:hypothetical protein AWENTII_004251 [Aspergillus wentii]
MKYQISQRVDSSTAVLDRPRNTRRSSSRAASRKSTRDSDINDRPLSRSSYSLPSTPLTASFDESQPSAKRRKTQRMNGDDMSSQHPKDTTETPDQKSLTGSHKDPFQKDDSERSHSTDQAVAPTITKARRKSQPAVSQSTLHTFLLKKPQERRMSLATESELLDSKNRNNKKTKPIAKPSNINTSIAQSNRKSRKSMSAKSNGTESIENGGDQSRATSRASTPHSTRSERKPRSTAPKGSAKAAKSHARAKSLSTPGRHATPRAAKGQANGTTKSAIFTEDSISTPKSSATRSRHGDRKPSTKPQSSLTSQIDDTPSQSTPNSKPNVQTSESIDFQTANTQSPRPKRNAKNSVTDTMTPDVHQNSLSTPRVPTELSHAREIADSVDGTPVHADKDPLHFDYEPEMYGSSFGLDAQTDAPASPTSFSTSTSTAARASRRNRKPTTKALESRESEKRFRRTRAASVKAESTSGEGLGENAGNQQASAHQPSELTQSGLTLHAPQQPNMSALGKRLYEMVATAVSADFVPDPGADAKLKQLRRDFWAKRGVVSSGEPVGARVGGESMPNSSKPSFLDRSQISKLWTDEDGWMHTGRINEHGEEYIFVSSDFECYRPYNTYGDAELPQPPVRFKAREQVEKDRIFGYPPRIGERNLPRQNLPFVFEDINREKAKIKAREDARQRGIPIERSLSVAEIEALIAQHDKSGASSLAATPDTSAARGAKAVQKTAGGSRKRRRTEPVKSSLNDSTTESAPRSTKRRRGAAAAAAETPTSSDKPKTLRLRLTFSKAAAAAAAAATGSPNGSSSKSEKRTDAATEDATSRPEGQIVGEKSPKKRKRSASEPEASIQPSTLTQSTIAHDAKDGGDTIPASPTGTSASAIESSNLTPGGRPRRRAAAALMAEFHNHAEERARRANARRKATPASEGHDHTTGQTAESVKST